MMVEWQELQLTAFTQYHSTSNESKSMPPRIIHGTEELRTLVGQELGVSDWLTVTQELIDRFAELTGDRQWIHIDRERACRESPYGATVAHGFLTLALLSRLQRQAVEVLGDFGRAINYGLNRVRFPAPLPAGSRIRSRCTLQGVAEVPEGIQLTWGIIVEREGEAKPVLAAEWLVRLYRL
jgi:acyl dehydratase